MNVTGQIIVNKHHNQLGNIVDRVDYEWIGGRYAYIDMEFIEDHPSLIKVGEVIKIGPFRTKTIWVDYVAFRITVLRVTSALDYFRYVFHRSSRIFDLSYRRLIVTAAVWNLGYFNNAVVPSWRDLYIVHWFNRTFHK